MPQYSMSPDDTFKKLSRGSFDEVLRVFYAEDPHSKITAVREHRWLGGVRRNFEIGVNPSWWKLISQNWTEEDFVKEAERRFYT